jgi:hypothetical protein
MTPEQLSKMCRCGHARRFHQQGTIWQGYSTQCVAHHDPLFNKEYTATGCLFFEDAAANVVIFRRDALGRFHRAKDEGKP